MPVSRKSKHKGHKEHEGHKGGMKQGLQVSVAPASGHRTHRGVAFAALFLCVLRVLCVLCAYFAAPESGAAETRVIRSSTVATFRSKTSPLTSATGFLPAAVGSRRNTSWSPSR